MSGRRFTNDDSDPLIAEILQSSANALGAERPHRAPTEPPIRVLIVELQRILRLGLVSLFGTARSCQVIGDVSTADEAVDEARVCSPDVIIMDADLPGSSGIAACTRMRADNAQVRVILLASVAGPEVVVAGIHAGARGYLLKQTEPTRLLEAVETVAAGGLFFESQDLRDALGWVRAGQPRGDPFSRLSGQERKILALIAQGKTNRDIATSLNLSQHTVKTYVSNALRKLGLTRRAEAAAFMVRRGLLGVACLAVALTGCAAQPAPAPPTDPFATVAQQSDKAFAQGQTLYQQGHYREALDAYRRARLLSPTNDPRIDDMIRRSGAELTPAPTEIPATATPMPEPSPTVPSYARPSTVPTQVPTVSSQQFAPTTSVPPPAQVAAPTPAAVSPPRIHVEPTSTPLPISTTQPTRTAATTMFISAGPAALDVLDALDQLFVADRSGLVWSLQHAQPGLKRPFSVAGDPVGLAADSRAARLYIAVRSQPALVAIDAVSGQQLASTPLSSDPGDVRVDSTLGLVYVVMPNRQALDTVDARSLTVLRSTPDLPDVTGIALDEETHTLYLTQLSGLLSVVNGQTGMITRRVKLTDEGLSGVATANGHVYAINTPGKELLDVDPSSADVNPIALAGEPASIAVGPGSGSVYVLDATTNAIVKIEPSDGTETGRVPVRDLSVGISSGLRPDALWLRPRMVVSTIDQRVYVIEPEAATLALAPPEI